MEKFIAIDPSTTSSGYAIFIDGKLFDYGAIDYSKIRDSEKRMNEMGISLLSLLSKEKPNAVYIEKPDGHNQNIAEMLGEMIGCVRAYCLAKKIYFEKVKPSQWRIWLNLGTGKRDEMKQKVLDYVGETYQIQCDVNDVSDAIGIGSGVIKHYIMEE